MKMQISHQVKDDGITVVRVSGRVMLGSEGGKIDKVLDELIGQGHRRFIFDISGVAHMDSTGIGRFVSALNKVREAGGKLRMAGATGGVREGFRVTRLDTIFEFFPDVNSATQGFD